MATSPVVKHIRQLKVVSGNFRSRLLHLAIAPAFLFITIVVHSLIVLGSYLFYANEVGINPQVQEWSDAAYWTIATVTTVGYGDIAPVTGIGKIIACILMILGSISIVAYAAMVTNALIAPDLAQVQSKLTKVGAKIKGIGENVEEEDVQLELLAGKLRELTMQMDTYLKRSNSAEKGNYES